jgi:cytochrome P450
MTGVADLDRSAALLARGHDFLPEERRRHGAFELIPQGGGSHDAGHRCAGEWITITLLEAAVEALVALEWNLPAQDLRVPLRRMPTLPRSRMVVDRVRAHAPVPA